MTHNFIYTKERDENNKLKLMSYVLSPDIISSPFTGFMHSFPASNSSHLVSSSDH